MSSSHKHKRATFVSRPSGVDAAKALAQLEDDVVRLRNQALDFVVHVGDVKVAPVVEERGVLYEPGIEDGPWELAVIINGPPATDYAFPYCVCLTFNGAWPHEAPRIRFRGGIHHALLDDEQAMLTPFYKNSLQKVGQRHELDAILKAVVDFLKDPVVALGLPAVPPNVRQGLEMSGTENASRGNVIQKYGAQVKHPDLFDWRAGWQREWFHPDLQSALAENTREAWVTLLEEHVPGDVFSFPMFTTEFCERFLDEVMNFYASGLPARRPNSMNNYGVIVDDIGMEFMITRLQEDVLIPLSRTVWPSIGAGLNSHHAFIVRYRENEDLGLDMHTDASDITFNVCLGKSFSGAGLSFCGYMGAHDHRHHRFTYEHKRGRCVVHLGRLRHGADDITSGERMNLIIWNRNSEYGRSHDCSCTSYERESGPPDPVCLSYTHDRDYESYKEVPVGKSRQQAWCPPPGKEHFPWAS